MKRLLLICLVIATVCSVFGFSEKTECPTVDCLQHGCKIAEAARKLQLPESQWPEFGRQFVRDEFCGEMTCCCAHH